MSIQKITELLSKTKEAYKREGFRYVVRGMYNQTFKKTYNLIYCKFLIHLRPPGTFTLQGQTYRYFYHPYNTTWKNERAVEIPIILEKIQFYHYQGGRILEVGNVLSHYVHFQHDIVDKYDKTTGVINQDVVDFQPLSENDKYDLIVSISTIEHVGWDETPRDPKKIPLALENLATKCLAPGGEIVVTLPIGYNAYLDKLLKELEKKGIVTRTFFIPMHEQPVFQKMSLFKRERYPVAEELAKTGMYLPSSSGLKEEEIRYICDAIKEIKRE